MVRQNTLTDISGWAKVVTGIVSLTNDCLQFARIIGRRMRNHPIL